MKDKVIIAVLVVVLLSLIGRLVWNKRSPAALALQNQTETTKNTRKVAYLTFDDGPSEVTEEILKVLKEKDVKATFFLVGGSIDEENAEIVKQEVKEGHTIGVHTFSHKKEDLYHSADSFFEDFDKAYKKIEEVTGIKPDIYRFPWGSVNCYLNNICDEIIEGMEKKGFTYYDWNVSAEDSVGTPTASSIMKNINKDFKRYEEPVILMHDSSINSLTAEMLPQIIDTIREAGYEFGTLDQRSKPYQYPRKR